MIDLLEGVCLPKIRSPIGVFESIILDRINGHPQKLMSSKNVVMMLFLSRHV